MQREFHDYDRKKCKRIRHVFYKKDLTENQCWYLERYQRLSEGLKKAHELKEAYNMWFKIVKANGENKLLDT